LNGAQVEDHGMSAAAMRRESVMAAADTWSAAQYVRFEDERNRPIHDLLGALSRIEVASAVDIGCGPGNSTERLQQRFPQARVYGFDSSPDMIAAARKRLPKIDFFVSDISDWSDGEGFDLILANAVLQWLPDHEHLMPRLMQRLNSGGALAVQMPDNLDEPAHVLMRETAAAGPWATKLADAAKARAPRHEPGWYYDVLRPVSARVEIWRTTYYHALSDAAAIVEWFKGSGLRPFLDPLDPVEREAYLAQYLEAVTRAHPAMAGGGVLLPFPRLFFVARAA
jgi:trans-aconitate 2-methyltransferase